MGFPKVDDYDFSLNGHRNDKMREALDYAEKQYKSKSKIRQRFDELYNAYNGNIDSKKIESITKSAGRQSKTKYVKYRLGRSKLKQLHGEFLEISITPTVSTVNPEAINEMMDKYKKLLGMSIVKPQLEKVREMGYNVYDGFNIPDRDDKRNWNIKNFKRANQEIMQDIINDKIQNQEIKLQLYNNFVDMTITAQMMGRIERNANGIDTFRFIPAKAMLFEEEVFDPFLERTPYKGEVRKMYPHEIVSNPEFNLSKEQRKQVMEIGSQGSIGDNKVEGNPEERTSAGTVDVYTIQWKGLDPVYQKISKVKGSKIPYKMILSKEYYKKNEAKIRRDLKNGKYELNTYYQETIWEASKIGGDIYTAAIKNENTIQVLTENGKYKAEFDYVGCLFSTVNGERVSLQEIIYELEKIYDDIRFQINREIKKIKGSAILYDKAFLPSKSKLSDVIYDISEDGIVTYDSSAEGNRSGTEAKSNEVGITSIDLGENQSLAILMNQAMDIERVMDRITGMNDNRQGLAKATSTATANVNNIEASRSMTYDLFYFMNAYLERMLMKLAEKTKLNKTVLGKDTRRFIFSDDQLAYLVATKDLDKDNYGIKVTDGKKERDVITKLEMMFPQEINAGIISSADVAKFLTESNFIRAIRTLEIARERYNKTQSEESKRNTEMAREQMEREEKRIIEDREDKQAHDLEMEVLRTEGKKEIKQMEIAGKGMIDAQKQKADMMTSDQSTGNFI
jgi:hypothetical protein